jgi:biotin operon repressor
MRWVLRFGSIAQACYEGLPDRVVSAVFDVAAFDVAAFDATALGRRFAMRRADRLFDIIQVLRTQTGPITARELAARLEVTVRTIYRDVATLQARRVPIEGAAGIGYLLRRGFDLPPLMFTKRSRRSRLGRVC